MPFVLPYHHTGSWFSTTLRQTQDTDRPFLQKGEKITALLQGKADEVITALVFLTSW